MSYIPKEYIQKSKHFLFPLTGLRPNEMVDPEGVYLFWNGGESIENYELIVHYKNTLGKLYEEFEKRVILRNNNLSACYTVEDGFVYVFDLMDYSNDINNFLEGKYSKMLRVTQRKIRIFNKDMDDEKTPKEGRYYHMVFNPDLYYGVVSKELEIPVSLLESVGELCPKYDKIKETLAINILKKGKCNNVPEFSQIDFL